MTLRPSLWASLVPRDPRERKPNHYVEMARVAWRNRDQLPYAWRVLSQGVCDGCALGTAGLRDWTLDGIHLCMVRLELLRLNTAPALDPERLRDLSALEGRSSRDLRELGRLPEPMIRRRGEKGFRVVSWEEAYDAAAEKIRGTTPERLAVYLTSRGILNEHYYAAQKAARAMGTNHVDNSARLCHAASTVAMKRTVGYGATTCSYTDWIGSDLIVFFGSNTPNNQPVTMKYLYEARLAGTKVAVVNTYFEPGLQKYWVPSVPESAIFGTRFADEWFGVDTGGDLAFLCGTLKALVAAGAVDEGFIARSTTGFAEARAQAEALSWERLERDSGAPRAEMERFARRLAAARNGIFVWSMGLTQHAHGVQTIEALVNVSLARGWLGREKVGLMPIRGHSGVQGGAEVGCAPGLEEPQSTRFAEVWGFPCPSFKGLTAAEMVDAAYGGGLDVFWIVGGNFLETLPDPAAVGRGPAKGGDAPASRRRAHLDDAAAPGGHGRDLPGHDALRVAGRGDGDLDRAADHLLARGAGPSDRIGEAGMGGLRRGRGAGAPGSRFGGALPVVAGDTGRDRARGPALRGYRAPRAPWRSVPVGRGAPLRGRPLPHAGRQGALLGGRAGGPAAGAGDVPRLHAAGQAVQLDGPARPRSAHGRPS